LITTAAPAFAAMRAFSSLLTVAMSVRAPASFANCTA
jgi:hypothetical protein